MIAKLEDLVIGNGGGAVKNMGDVINACRSAATRITVGSVTVQKRDGNIGETYYADPVDLWTINSLGLPNIGMCNYRAALPYMVEKAHAAGKQLYVSLAGFSPEDYADMAVRSFDAHADGIELNLSCPNVWSKSGRKAIPFSDPEMLNRIYDAVGNALPSKYVGKPITAKASPTDDAHEMKEFAEVTATSGLITEVIGFNTEGGKRRTRSDGKDALAFRADEADQVLKHEGGLAGAALSDATPRRIRMLCDMLPPSIPVVALGGIFNGAHAFKNLEAGAKGFMCTSSYMINGAGVFSNILEGLTDLVPQAA